MSSYTDIFGNFNVQPSQSSYSSYTINASIQLAWPLQFIDTTNVVSNIIDVNATVGALIVQMPDATQTGVGSSVIFNNVGANTFTLTKDDAVIITTLSPSQSLFIYLVDNTTVGGTWRFVPFGGGITSVTSVAATSSNSNLVITGSPVTSSGTFVFSFAHDLLALVSFGASAGISVRTAVDTWALRTITGTANQISVVNGSGVGGNPTISLPTVITGINDITIGNINIAANTITTTNANGDMILSCNGTGITRLFNNVSIMQAHELQFKNSTNSGYVGFKGGNSGLGAAVIWTLPLADGTNGQVWSTNGAGVLSWASVVNFSGTSTNNAIAKYNGTAGALQDSGVIISATNNITGANSIVAGNIGIGTLTANTITTTNANGDLFIEPNGTGGVSLGSPGGAVSSLVNFSVASGNSMSVFNAGNTFSSGFKANPALAATFTWNLPLTDGGANSLMLTDGAGNLGWTPAGSGKLVLISSQTAAASANISFSSGSNTFPVYNSYYIVIRDLIPSNNDVQLYVTFSTDGGATWANTSYWYTFLWNIPGGFSNTNAAAVNQAQIVIGRNAATTGIPNTADTPNAPYNAAITIYNASGTNYTSISADVNYIDTVANGNQNYSLQGTATYRQAVAINGIRFTLSAGNITSGVFTLYGLNT